MAELAEAAMRFDRQIDEAVEEARRVSSFNNALMNIIAT